MLYGTTAGIQASNYGGVGLNDQFITQDFTTHDSGNAPRDRDHFGRSLATGDFNGDGFADLAVSADMDDLDELPTTVMDAGVVHVIYGSASGLQVTSPVDLYWYEGSNYLLGTADVGDLFGRGLVAGNFNGDTNSVTGAPVDDLAVGVPGQISAVKSRLVPSSTIYAGTAPAGVFKSVTGGLAWVASGNGLTDSTVYDIAIDPSVSSRLYVATRYGGVFKSDDAGGHWAAVNQGLPLTPGLNVERLAIDPSAPSTIYAGTAYPAGGGGDGVFKTTDAGQTWTWMSNGIVQPFDTSVYELVVSPSAPATLLASSGCFDDIICENTGIYRCMDAGSSWQGSLSLITPGDRFEVLAINPASPETVLAAHATEGVYLSTDAGVTWVSANNGLTNKQVYALSFAPSAPSTAYLVTAGGQVFKTT